MTPTQGQSGYTRFKQERFAPVLAQSLRISKAAAVARFPFYHVDLNAGSGFNHEAAVVGSPINFLQAVQRTGRENFYGFFVDHSPEAIRDLIKCPAIEAHSTRVALFQADNSEILPVVAEFIAARERNPQFAVGAIVVDPNGYHGGVPWEALRVFCAGHPRFDLFLNLNIRSFRLERPHIASGHGRWGQHYRLHPMSEFAEWFTRPSWMWTDVCQIAGSSWMQFVGRTMRTEAVGYARLGFYDSQSERGRAILHSVEQPGGIDSARSTAQLPLLSNV